MRLSKWMALALVLCLLAGMLTWASSEEPPVISERVEGAVGASDEAGEDTGLTTEGGDALLSKPTIAPEDEDTPGDSVLKGPDAAPADCAYGRATAEDTPVYCDTVSADVLAYLGKGEVVLMTGAYEGLTEVAVNARGRVATGYMMPEALEVLSEAEVGAYQDRAAESGSVALYNGDLELPLCDLARAGVRGTRLVRNGNYIEYSNDTMFTLNGKQICANMVPDKGLGNCWAWAQGIYQLVWGVRFTSTFVGNDATGLNMLRDLNDEERLLTPEHLKTFVRYAVPGSTIRVSSCTSQCSQFENDGLRCGHKGHSLIIAEWREDGVVTLDDHSNSQHTRFYSWQGFCNSWKNYTYVKYIKWPNAPTTPTTEMIGDYEVRSCSDTYRVRATAESGATVWSAPENGETLATLAYPATFSATKRAVKTYGGYAWVYGTTEAGVTGWLPLNDDVVNVNDAVPVTGVTLSQAKLVLLTGGEATLSATVLPVDATNREVSWSSGDTSVAAVSDGRVTAVGVGKTTVTATTKDGAKAASCEVQVVQAEGQKVLSRTGSNGTVNMLIGQRLQLVPQFATKRGWKIKDVKISNRACVTVDRTGMVTAVAAGKTVITVITKNNKRASLTVRVYDPYKLTSIRLNRSGTVRMKVGKTMQLSYSLTPATAMAVITWKTSNAKVAAIDDSGRVTAVGKGSCYVGVIADSGKYARVKVKVS